MRTIPRRIDPAQPDSPARTAAARPGAAAPESAAYRIDWDALRTAERACCCPARPVVIAIIPAAPGRPHKTDLLLCLHHFRVSERAMAASGATVFDRNGRLVAPDAAMCLAVG